jgi:hypothetical protein
VTDYSDFSPLEDEDLGQDVERGDGSVPFQAVPDPRAFPAPDATAARRPVQRASYEKIAKLIEFCIRAHDESAKPLYEEWVANRRMRFETEAPKPRSAQDPLHRKRWPVDIVGPVIAQRNSLIADQTFQIRCTPASVEPQDAFAAEQVDALIKYHERVDDPDQIRSQWLAYAVDTSGISIAQTYYDPNSGPIVGIDMSSGRAAPVHEGMYRSCVIPTWEVGVDPNASGKGDSRFEDAGWALRRQWMTRSELARILPPEQMQLVADAKSSWRSAADGMDQSQALYLLDDPSGRFDTTRSANLGESALARPYRVVEFWKRRSDEWPQGLYVRYVNKTVVAATPAPYADFDEDGALDIPLVAYCDIPYEGRFWGKALSTKLRASQEQATTTNSAAVERDQAVAYAKFFASGIERIDKTYNTENGQFIFSNNPMAKIEMFDPLPGGPERYHAVDRAERYAERIAHVSRPSRGIEGGIEGGTDKTKFEVGALLGASQIATSEVVRRLNRAHQAIVRNMLIVAHGMYSVPRQLRIAGEQAGAQVRAFVGSDITGQEDVHVFSSRFIPPGPDGRIQAVEALLNFQERAIAQQTMARMQGIDPIVTVEAIGNVLGYESDLFDDTVRVEQLARTEAEMLLSQGIPPNVTSPHDEYIVRLKVYRSYFSNRLYREAPPQLRALFDNAVAATAMLAQQQRMRDVPVPPTPPGEDETANDNPGNKAPRAGASPNRQAA